MKAMSVDNHSVSKHYKTAHLEGVGGVGGRGGGMRIQGWMWIYIYIYISCLKVLDLVLLLDKGIDSNNTKMKTCLVTTKIYILKCNSKTNIKKPRALNIKMTSER